MLIGIDARLWSQTGVGRYIRNLIKNLSVIDKKNNYVLFVWDPDFDLVKNQIKNPKWKIVKTKIKWHTTSEQIKFVFELNKYNFNIFHFPYFSIPILYRKKYVVTVHDLIINKFRTGNASTLPYPKYLTKRIAYKVVLRNALKKSKKIIVPSQSVKKDLLFSYKNIDSHKIEVTYEGGFENLISKKERPLNYKYFLRVGNFYPHKNVESLLTAFKIFIDSLKDENIKLVLVGKKDFFFKGIENKIKYLKLESSVIVKENPDDSELCSLYKNSLATIVPSYMEGFSLTAVEAMSLGCLVIASDIAVHREICREGAIYFNPNDSFELYERLVEVIRLEKEKKEKMLRLFKNISEEYSWAKMARKTLKIYENASSTNPK